MKPCKYQRIVRDGKVVQPGDIDTQAKFAQLVAGIDLSRKRFLDVGCNCGEMCRLAAERGARTNGIDINRDYVYQARELNPRMRFSVRPAEMAVGKYDVVVASAMFHYIRDYRTFFARMAQVTTEVLAMDVWLIPSDGAKLTLSHRGGFVPNEAAFLEMARPWFGEIVKVAPAISPDNSERWIFHLRKPKPIPAKAVLIYGKGGVGKTTRAKELFDHQLLQLDGVFVALYRAKKMSSFLSVASFVNAVNERNDPGEMEEYYSFHRDYLRRWLGRKMGMDVVIEGYDMLWPKYREMVIGLVKEIGWDDITEIEL